MKEIFYEIIKEAKTGKIVIDNEEWPIGFNTIIYDNNAVKISFFNDFNLSTLVIKNEEEFLNYLKIYLEKELKSQRRIPSLINKSDIYKRIISYLFVNASIKDFEDPISYLKTRIDFLDNNSLTNINTNINLGKIFTPKIEEDIYLTIKSSKQGIMMETPEVITIGISNNKGQRFRLPSISYGISNDTCHIYSILNKNIKPKNQEEEKFQKIVSRQLYKINEGVTDKDVKDVTMSSVLALSIFISLLKKKNITKLKAYLYLPLRYLSREIIANSKEDHQKSELLNRNNYIQTNITEKFLRTIERLIYQVSGIEITNDLYVDNGIVDISLDRSKEDTNNDFLSKFFPKK